MARYPSRSIRKAARRCFAASALLAALFLLQALWVPAKAALGQVLLEHSWRQLKRGQPGTPPWPWADTAAMAVLEVPALAVREIVVANTSARNLAWGPVMHRLAGGYRDGDLLLSGHRDTHFRFLQQLRTGDRLRLDTGMGPIDYRVTEIEVVDSRQVRLLPEPGLSRLSLVTCYPFSSPRAGGPLRYVVTALQVRSPE